MKRDNVQGEIVWFLFYVFLIPFLCVGIMKGVSGPAALILYGLEAASPAIAAVLVMLQKHGREGLKQFLLNKYYNHVDLKLCVTGFFLPAMVLTIGKAITYLTPYHNQFIRGLSAKKVIIIAWALIAEELGWRGFLQEQLDRRLNVFVTPLILGLIWTAWHSHFWISGTMDVPIVAFAMGCILESYGYYVITKLAKRNVLPASIWHFSGNLFFNLYRINPNWNNDSEMPYVLVTGVDVVYVVIFYWYVKYRRKELRDAGR